MGRGHSLIMAPYLSDLPRDCVFPHLSLSLIKNIVPRQTLSRMGDSHSMMSPHRTDVAQPLFYFIFYFLFFIEFLWYLYNKGLITQVWAHTHTFNASHIHTHRLATLAPRAEFRAYVNLIFITRLFSFVILVCWHVFFRGYQKVTYRIPILLQNIYFLLLLFRSRMTFLNHDHLLVLKVLNE